MLLYTGFTHKLRNHTATRHRAVRQQRRTSVASICLTIRQTIACPAARLRYECPWRDELRTGIMGEKDCKNIPHNEVRSGAVLAIGKHSRLDLLTLTLPKALIAHTVCMSAMVEYSDTRGVSRRRRRTCSIPRSTGLPGMRRHVRFGVD